MNAMPERYQSQYSDARTNSRPQILAEGHNCWRISRADRAAFLVDGEDYFAAFADAALQAQESIIIVGWDFDSRTLLRTDSPQRGCPTQLGDFLNYLAKRRHGLKIHILTWDFPVIYGTDRETPPLFGSGWRRHRRIHLEYDGKLPVGASHHQKIVVIDNAMAFVGGLDLTRKRWDTSDHFAEHPDRQCEGASYAPFHDVMMAVDGPAAADLGFLARERWRRANGTTIRPPQRILDPWPDQLFPEMVGVDVAIARTEPAYDGREGVQEVEALYLDAIAAARNVIYIENQYFTSAAVGEALAQWLQEPDGPEIVLVLRAASNGWLEGVSMGAMRDQLLKRLRAADRHQHLHAYFPAVPGLGSDCINVHSKVLIVDDQLLRIGSANINNRSMVLDTECDLAIEASGDAYVSKAILDFRNRLLAEHLGATSAVVARTCASKGSLHGAIQELRGASRWLAPFESVEEWPESVATLASYLDPEKPVPLDELMDEFSPDTSAAPRGPIFLKIFVILAVIGGLLAAWRWTPLSEWATADRVTALAMTMGDSSFAPLLFVAAYTFAAVTFFPRPLITLAAVLVFGAWQGFAYAMLGIVIAALVTYGLGRAMNRHTVRRLAGHKLNNLALKMGRANFLTVGAIRLLPIAPFVLMNIVAGAVRVRLNHYVAGTALGMLPGTLAATIFGDQITSSLRNAGQLNYWIVAAVVTLWLVIFFAVRRWWMRKK